MDFEGELISVIDELNQARRKNKQLKERVNCAKEGIYNSDNEEFFYQK